MAHRQPHIDTVKSKHGVAPGWKTPSELSAQLDAAAARRATDRMTEPYVPAPRLVPKLADPAHEGETTTLYTSPQRVKLHALNRHIVAINDALPAEYAGWDRAKAIRDMAKKLGMKSMGDYRG